MTVSDDDAPRVLVVVQGERDRELLVKRLRAEYEVVVPGADGLPDRFDCCVVDDRSLGAVGETLARRRTAAEPVLLPVMLLVRPSDRAPDPWVRYRDHIGDTVDDVATLPLGDGELRVRLSALLRSRRFSTELAARREELELYRRAMDEAEIGITITDADDDQPITYANEGFERITGYDAAEITGRNCRFLQGEGTDDEPVAAMARAVAAAEPETVVVRNYRADGEPFWNEVSIVPVRDADGTLTHFLGFQRDVTARVERRRRLERYERMVETTDDLVFAIDDEGRLTMVNQALADFQGVPREELIGQPGAAFMLDEDAEQLPEVRASLAAGETVTMISRSRGADGEVAIFENRLAPLFEDGEYAGLVGIARDVTDRRELEADLREERELLANMFEASPAALTVLDADGRIVRANDRAREVLRVAPGDTMEGQFDAPEWEIFDENGESIPSEDLPFARVMRTGESVRGYEHGIRGPDGEEIWLTINAAPLLDEAGEVTNVVNIIQDVTERKERERRYEAVFNGTYQFTGLMEPDGTLLEANETALAFGGIEREEVVGKKLWNAHWFQHGDAADRAREAVERAREGEFVRHELDIQGEDRIATIDFSVRPITDERGEVTLLVPEGRDITELKEHERELEGERTRLSLALSAADAGVFEWDLASDEVEWDDQTYRLFGLEPGAFEGTYDAFLERVHRADRSRVEAAIESTLDDGDTYDVRYRIVRPDGSVRWLSEMARLVRNEAGEPASITGVVLDVTEQVERQNELERTVDLYSQTQSTAAIGGWEVDVETGEVLWTDQVYEILGLPDGLEPDLEEALRYYPEPDRERVRAGIERAVEAGEPFDVEVQVEPTDGERRWVRVRGEATERAGQAPVVRGTFQDVTDRKEYEVRLERFQRIVQTAEDPIFATDAEGRFTLVNDAMVELAGASRDALVGRKARDAVWDEEGYDHETMVADLLDGQPVQVTTWAESPDGDVREFAVRLSPLFDDGEYVGAVGVARDVTDVRERERRLSVLDRVLRHNLRNKLNLVLAYAESITESTEDAHALKHAHDILEVTEDLLAVSRDAREFQASIDPDAGDVGAVDLAERLAGAVHEVETSHPEARLSVDAPATAPVTAHEGIDLAIEELLENAIVHDDAPDPTVEVTLDRDGEEYVLRIADEGPGIGPIERAALTRGEETQLQHSTGLGLWLVRWTITSSGGTLDIVDREPRGTEVVVRLPAAERRVAADGG